MVFLYLFSPHTTIILFQVAKKLEKRNGEMVLYFYFAFNRQAVYIENETLIIKKDCKTVRVKLNLFIGFVECNTFFTH